MLLIGLLEGTFYNFFARTLSFSVCVCVAVAVCCARAHTFAGYKLYPAIGIINDYPFELKLSKLRPRVDKMLR